MSRWVFRWACVLAIALAFYSRPNTAAAAEKSAAEILPSTTVAYIEISRPKEVIALLLDSPLRRQVEKSEQYRKAIDSPKFGEFQMILGFIEQKSGVKWRSALEAGTGDGIVIAYDPTTKGLAILAKAMDAKTANAFRDAFFSLARDDAKNKGNPDPIPTKDYRGLTAYSLGEATMVNLGSWIVISNKGDLAKAMADKYLDGGSALTTDKAFADARKAAFASGGGPLGWAFVRLDPLRAEAANIAWLDAKFKSDNPAVEFLVGGLMPVLRKTRYLTAALSIDKGDVKIALAVPVETSWIPPQSKFFFATAGDGAAKPLRPKGMLASVTMYRDASGMWQAGPDLFTEEVAAKMAQADSALSGFFGGKAFGTDVLGAIKPQIQLVATLQDFKAAGVQVPNLRLPSFAIVARVQPTQFEAIRKQLRVGFQTALTFANLDATNKGRPLLEIQSEKRAGADIMYAAYDRADKPKTKDDTYLNFSPALVMSGQYLMLCTTRQIAEDLADLAEKEGSAKPTISDNALIEIDGAGVATLIKDDREQLIAQNMLEKGHDRPEAEKEIDLLQTIVGAFENAKVRLVPGDRSIELEVELKLVGTK